MKNQVLASISMLLILTISPLAMAFASTETTDEDFLNIREATIDANSDELSAFLETHGHIPTDGDGGAFGYGVLTTEGLDAVIVSTTHAGVHDSELQEDANDPVWHNHFVALSDESENCGSDLEIRSITYESPGQISVEDNTAELTDIPASFSGTEVIPSFTEASLGDEITLEPGTDVEDVVSFRLAPIADDDDELVAVCVTDIQSAENIVFDNNENGNQDGNDSNNNNENGNQDGNDSNNNNDDGNSASQGIGQSQSTIQ